VFDRYFFVLFGSSGLVSLITNLRDPERSAHDPSMADMNNPMMQMNPAATPMMPGLGAPDFKKVFQQERESLDMTVHNFALDGVEDYVLTQPVPKYVTVVE